MFMIERYTEYPRQRYPNFKINTVDFGTLALREQVLVAQGTASLVGHHGTGMTHVFFIPEQSAMIKISPRTPGLAGFCHLSKMRQRSYFVINSMWVGDWRKKRELAVVLSIRASMKANVKTQNGYILGRRIFNRWLTLHFGVWIIKAWDSSPTIV